jgi:predicted RNA-binding Zn ribbon-like protein
MKDPFDSPWPGFETSGRLSLALANTLDWRLRAKPVELMRTFSDLVRWGRTGGVLDRAEATRLRGWAKTHPRPATRLLRDATEIREAIAAIFQALVRGSAPPAASLERLEHACRAAWSARTLRADASSAEWTWRESTPEPERIAWAAALDAAGLLTSGDAHRVRQCGDAECGWFFLDTSRNKSRRWCSMESCGNRNKVRRFYRRSRET